jgi:hypothetical protein
MIGTDPENQEKTSKTRSLAGGADCCPFEYPFLISTEAIRRRQRGEDIVMCGPDPFENDKLAGEIERAATPVGGRCIYHGPHGGPLSLPHWQQETKPPEGHSFHETNVRQARVTP